MPRSAADPAPSLPWCLLVLLVVQHALLLLPACAQASAGAAPGAFSLAPPASLQHAGTTHGAPLNNTLRTRMEAAVEAEERLAALFQYLVSQSNATEYFLLYDASLPGLAGAITTGRGRRGGLTLHRCSSSPSSLEWWLRGIHGALTEGYHPTIHRNVLVVCPASRTSEIFDKADQVGLASPSVHWYVVLEEEGVAEGNLAGLQEGMQVTVAERGNDSRYHLLASYVNMSGETAYRLVEATDGQWGEVLPSGWVTGMVGVVARREADLAVNEITILDKRETVVDFSTPYYMESTVLVSQAPREKNRAFAAFSPFSALVWVMVMAVTLVMGPVLAAVVWVRERCFGRSRLARVSLSSFSFTVFRSLVVQSNLLFPKDIPLRIIFFFWYLFCFLIYALYAGTLTAVLALPTFTKPIETLTDLLVAARQGIVHPAAVEGTSNAFLFKAAKDGIYKEIWDVFDTAIGYAKNYDAGVDKVMEGPFVFINARLGSEVRAAARGIQKFYISRDSFYPQCYGIAFPVGSPIRIVVNPMLTSITASGLIGKWMRDEVRKVTKSVEVEKSYAITLVHLQAAFFILLIGFLMAAAALFLEIVCHRYGLYQGKVRATPGTSDQNGCAGNVSASCPELCPELPSVNQRPQKHMTRSSLESEPDRKTDKKVDRSTD